MKKKIILLSLACSLTFGILPSCKEDITNSEIQKHKTEITYKYVKPDQKNNVIMPLEVGNEWVYKITNYDEQGAVTSTEYKTIRIDGVEQFNGEKWYYSDNKTILWVNTDLGLMTKNVTYEGEKEFRAKYPTNQGDEFLSWIAGPNNKSLESSNIDSEYTKILFAEFHKKVNINIPITTVTGSFNCFEYRDKIINPEPKSSKAEFLGMSQYSTDYYTENIGLIKSVNYRNPDFDYSFDPNYVVKIVELISYKLN